MTINQLNVVNESADVGTVTGETSETTVQVWRSNSPGDYTNLITIVMGSGDLNALRDRVRNTIITLYN